MKFTTAFLLICGLASHAFASVQVSISASDSTWLVPAGGSVVGYTDFYMTVRYDGEAPSLSYAFSLDYIDGGVPIGSPPFHFNSVPLWDELSGAWFSLPSDMEYPYVYPESHTVNVWFFTAISEGTNWPVGEITKPLIRLNYLLDPSVDTTFTAQWEISGYAVFSGSVDSGGYTGPISAATTNQITALVVPNPIPEPLSVLVWVLLGAVAFAVPGWRRRFCAAAGSSD